MEELGPVHVVGPDDAERRRVVESLEALEVRVHDTVDAARSALDDERRLVILTGTVPCPAVLELARRIVDEDRSWILVRAGEEVEGEPAFRPVSSGFAVEAGRVPDALAARDEEQPIFDLLEVLRIVARVRHDINNPLTAGLAETQLLLMDVEDEETREALETVQRQLQRIQELVQTLTRLRRPARRIG